MTRENEITNAALEAMTEVLMSTPNYEFSPKATDLLECAYIKGAEWADKHPANPWHSVDDGDWPKCGYAEDVQFVVMLKDGDISLAYYDEDANGICDFYDDCDCPLDVKYWMEIPEIKMEIQKKI